MWAQGAQRFHNKKFVFSVLKILSILCLLSYIFQVIETKQSCFIAIEFTQEYRLIKQYPSRLKVDFIKSVLHHILYFF